VKYAILMYAAPSHTRGMSGSELDGIARKHAKLRDELTASGELAGGAGLVLPDETLVLSAPGHKSRPAQAARAGRSGSCAARRSSQRLRSVRVNFHPNGSVIWL
jgi:hypothetical protein